jgi:hypothetical protein
MLPFGVTFPATVPQRSEIPEGLMNYPVLIVGISVRLIYFCSATHILAEVRFNFVNIEADFSSHHFIVVLLSIV